MEFSHLINWMNPLLSQGLLGSNLQIIQIQII